MTSHKNWKSTQTCGKSKNSIHNANKVNANNGHKRWDDKLPTLISNHYKALKFNRKTMYTSNNILLTRFGCNYFMYLTILWVLIEKTRHTHNIASHEKLTHINHSKLHNKISINSRNRNKIILLSIYLCKKNGDFYGLTNA